MAHTVTAECVNCGACDPTCPVKAISESGNARTINPAICNDCGICVESCPIDAIEAP